MTNKQVAEINKIVKECRHRQQGVCRMQVLPCARAIDKGICPEIIDYLQKHRAESEDKPVSALMDDMKSGVDRMIDDGLKMIEKCRAEEKKHDKEATPTDETL